MPTNEEYEYFVSVWEYMVDPKWRYNADRPSSMWRSRGGRHWEFLSLFDWEWHSYTNSRGRTKPESTLYPISTERAAELEADRQGWFRYWAYYYHRDEWRDGEAPTSVIRRRSSPEWISDELFDRHNQWVRTTRVEEFMDMRGSGKPHLIEITPTEADEILLSLRGVAGATALGIRREPV
ncbi:hypothetical protein [Nocardia asteroides]|uniref:hypothetical protein n=1 Tax=Nocardia asteroides TaxID=1824 RepID=UPI00342AB9CD